MPAHGERRAEEDTVAGRQATILSVLQPGDVLVGHSGGGYDITMAADAAVDRVGHLVYLAAGLPLEGRTIPEAMADRGADADSSLDDPIDMFRHLRRAEGGGFEFADVEGARTFFYHDCDDATVRWAFDHLTPEHFGEITRVQVSVPRFWAAELPRSYVWCLEDRAKPAALSEVVVRRLGVEPLTIEASHSPFLSRPAELAEPLVHATTTSPVGPLLPN
jgi:pimeloyl-ACP methyl ester carboxylesterase